MKIVDSYIRYLRNISRKIVSRRGFDSVLPAEKKSQPNYYQDLNSHKNRFSKETAFVITNQEPQLYSYCTVTERYLDTVSDKRLFMGLGLINGEHKVDGKKAMFSAPLFYAVADLEKDEGGYLMKIDTESYQLNYDLFAKLFHIEINEDYENYSLTEDDIKKFKLIEEIENKFFDPDSDFLDSNENGILDYLDVFNLIKEQITECKDIEVSPVQFDYEKRVTKMGGGEESAAKFYDQVFLFVNTIPDELSTYEALNKLAKKPELENPVLNKIFENVLAGRGVTISKTDAVKEEELNAVIERRIPLSLSGKQKEAIKNAWLNEVSYIQGPPGTGKSHTIASILLSAVFLNKRVLLVSQKKAAIDVVKNMVEAQLGKDSILFVGSKDKTSTKDHLEDLISSSGSLRYQANTEKLNKLLQKNKKIILGLDLLNAKIKEVRSSLEEDLTNENKYFRIFTEFLRRRDNFLSIYSPKEFGRYKFNPESIDDVKIQQAISRYKSMLGANPRKRSDTWYLIKFFQMFRFKFAAELENLKGNTQYADDIYAMNSLFAQSENTLKQISRTRYFQLTKTLRDLKSERQKYFEDNLAEYYISSKIISLMTDETGEMKNSLQVFKGMLHFKNPSIVTDKMNKIDFSLLTSSLPLWCSELRDLGNYFPMQSGIFDLVVVDESSQVNLAEIIPAFYRGKQFSVVGDDKQLHLNATGVGFAVSKSFDKLSWNSEMNRIRNQGEETISFDGAQKKDLIVTESSVLNFITSEANDFYTPKTVLNEHYRSLPKLAKFNNDSFYDSGWKIMTENGYNIRKQCFKAVKVEGTRDTAKDKEGNEKKLRLVSAEIDEAIRLLKLLTTNPVNEIEELKSQGWDNNYVPSIGILSFLTNQKLKLQEIIEEEFSTDIIDKYKIFTATTEEFQGNEKDIMIITFGLDGSTSWSKAFYENPNRFNVATSRAKYFTYAVYAGIPGSAALLYKYFNHFGINLRTAAEPVDEIKAVQKPDSWKYNSDVPYTEYETKIAEYLTNYTAKHPELELYNKVDACGEQGLDFVIYNTEKKITCSVEIDGKDHVLAGNQSYTDEHFSREESLGRAGWVITNVKFYNWYSAGRLSNGGSEKHFEDEVKRLQDELDENLKIK